MRVVLFKDVIFVVGRDVAAPEAGLAQLVIRAAIRFVFEAAEAFCPAARTFEAVMSDRLGIGYSME